MNTDNLLAAPQNKLPANLPGALETLNPTLTEDLALSLLQKSDLASEIIQQISQTAALVKSRKVSLALVTHPRAARHIARRLMRDFYTADLVQFALRPSVPADLKSAAAELLLARLPSIPLGERLSLARRCPASVATALLLDKEPRVWQAALENPRLTEASIVKALRRPGLSETFIAALCRNPQWSSRIEIRAALLLNEKTPLSYALIFARSFRPAQLRDILHVSRLPAAVKTSLAKALDL